MFYIRVFSILCLTIAVALGAQPQAPPSVTATPFDCTSVSISWQAASGNGSAAPSQYLVYRDNASTLIATVASTISTFVDANAGAYSTHSYGVSTKTVGGQTSAPTWSGSVATGTLCPPDAPTGLAASAANCSQVNLSWAAPARTGAGLAGYRVYRNGGFIKQVTTTSTADTGLTGSTTYLYEVSALDVAGRESVRSQIYATTLACPVTAGPPGRSRISFQGDHAVVDWPGYTGVLYQVECSSDFGRHWIPVDAPTTSFSTTNVRGGPIVMYRVAWFTNTSEYAANFALHGPDAIPPTDPTDIALVPDSQGPGMILSWVAATDSQWGVQGYFLYRDAAALAFVPDSPNGSLSYTDRSGSFDATYEIAAVDKAGNPSSRVAPSSCAATLSTYSWSAPAAGGSVNVSVTTGKNCNWTVDNPCTSWLTASPTSGKGSKTVTLTATSNGTGTSRSCTVTISGQTFIVTQPSSSPCTYAVTTSSSPTGGGTTSGGGTVNCGATVTVTATPGGCYNFANWTENGNFVSSSASYSFAANANRNLLANFSVKTFAVGVSASPSAGGTVSGGGNYSCGSTATVVATANAGYSFVSWTENGNYVSGSASYTFTANASRTLVANFSQATYAINTSSSPAAGGATSGGGTVASGSSVTVIATANAGYSFVSWTENGNYVSGSASYTFTANASRTLVANFSQVAYAINTSSSPAAGGATSGGGTVASGSSVTVIATANAGYNFANWTENGSAVSSSTSYTFTANGNRTLVANFIVTPSGWPKRFGGTGVDFGLATAVDGAGNIIVVGVFSGTVDFGGGPLTSAGLYDVFLAKYTPSGAHLWSKRHGGADNDSAKTIAQDANGNIYLGGTFVGGSLAKFSATGDWLWTKGPAASLSALAIDSQGNVVVTGSFQGGNFSNQIDFGDGHTLYSDYGSTDALLAKYSATGACLWAKNFRNYGGTEVGTGVMIDASDNIITAGYANSSGFSLDGGATYFPSAGGYLGKFLPNGDHVWSRLVGTDGPARPLTMTLDPSGNIAMSGYFPNKQTQLGGQPGDAPNSIVTGTALNVDLFLARYSGSTGAFQWGRSMPGTAYGWAYGLASDAQGNFIMAGKFRGTVNFGAQTLISSTTADNGYVAKYTSTGAAVWAKMMSSPAGNTDGNGFNAVVTDAQGNVIVTGGFTDSTTFNGQSFTTAGSSDILVGKLSP